LAAKPPQVAAIGGSDPSGGAGVQADAKAIHANGGFCVTIVTSVTAQNTREVRDAFDLPPEIIRAQIDSIFDDFEIAAAKTGMLRSARAVEVVSEALARHAALALVVDPVMVSTSGFPLLDEMALEPLKRRLLPLARVCTPNRLEAEVLSGLTIRDLRDAENAARRIRGLGPQAVLIKGGHLEGPRVSDLLLDGDEVRLFGAQRLGSDTPHGTGCTLAAAVATWLARGVDLSSAVVRAKQYVTEAIRGSVKIGRGHPVPDHFFFLEGRDWTTFGRPGGGASAKPDDEAPEMPDGRASGESPEAKD